MNFQCLCLWKSSHLWFFLDFHHLFHVNKRGYRRKEIHIAKSPKHKSILCLSVYHHLTFVFCPTKMLIQSSQSFFLSYTPNKDATITSVHTTVMLQVLKVPFVCFFQLRKDLKCWHQKTNHIGLYHHNAFNVLISVEAEGSSVFFWLKEKCILLLYFDGKMYIFFCLVFTLAINNAKNAQWGKKPLTTVS